jgi:hypothetical protein
MVRGRKAPGSGRKSPELSPAIAALTIAMEQPPEPAMATATVRVSAIIQNDQSLPIMTGRMVSKAVFDVEAGGTTYRDCWCVLSRPVGTGYSDEPFEVGPPQGYPSDQPWNLDAFGEKIAHYYTTREFAVTPSFVGDIVRANSEDSRYTFTMELPE